MTSAPASTARTAASPTPYPSEMARIRMASVRTRPSNPISSRRSSVRKKGERVAGGHPGPRIPGTATWAVMTASTPSSTARRKGTNSRASSRARSASTMGSSTWESVLVSPWPGKCLAVVRTPPSSGTGQIGGPQPRHGLRVLAEGAGVDDGVQGVGVHIQNRSEVQVNPHGPGLDSGYPAVLPGEPVLTDGPESHGGGKRGPTPLGKKGGKGIAVVDPHSRPAVLEIRGDQEGYPGPGLEGVQLGPVGVGKPDGDDHPADSGLLHVSGILLEFGAGGGGVGPRHPGHDELADGLPQGQRREGFLHPLPPLGVRLREEHRPGRKEARQGPDPAAVPPKDGKEPTRRAASEIRHPGRLTGSKS